MKVILKAENTYTLFFKRGEEIMSELKNFLVENDVRAAHLSGLGAADKIEIAYYDMEKKEYERHVIEEDVEILNVNGNVGIKEDGDTVIHAHGSFGKRDLSVIGGHIFSMHVSGAGEIHLVAFPNKTINRAYDDETGLTLMCNVKD